MAKAKTKDMTVGNPMSLILGFTLPMTFGFLFQQFYTMADTLIVGRFLGVKALAAVGSTGSVNFFTIGFCMGVCNGFGLPVAQMFGAKDERAMRKYVGNGAVLSLIAAVLMTAIFVGLCRPILQMMNTPTDIFEQAYSYIVVIFAGIPAVFLYNLLSSYIRALGDAKTPVILLVASAALNIVLDLLLIIVFKMGVAGAAYATIISQGVSGVGCFLYMKKKYTILHLSKDDFRLQERYVKNLCKMGIPMGLQYSITAIGTIVIQAAVNSLGSAAVAAVSAGSRLQMFFACPFEAMGATMATYGGQNVGAKRLDRIDQGLKSCLILGAVYSVVALIIIVFFGKTLGSLFITGNNTGQIIQWVHEYQVWNVAGFFLLAMVNIVRFLIQGMGFSSFAILAGVCEMVARVVVAFALVPLLGYTGICTANIFAWIAADLFLIPAYFIVRKKLQILFKQETCA